MQKLQILFPNPLMSRLRSVAGAEDRPVSEIVRRAVERYLQQMPSTPKNERRSFPTFRGGGVLIPANRLKQEIYADDAGQS
jgi:hypothetical protein